MDDQNPYLSPAAVQEPPPAEATPTLWNPTAAACWSLLFSPAFGAFLHARNWKALGEPGKARVNLIWFYVAIAVLLAVLFVPMPENLDQIERPLGIALLLGWYFSIGKAQVSFVKEQFNGHYRKRSWLPPIGVALVSIVGLFGAAVLVAMAQQPTAESNAEVIAAELKPMIEEQWKKDPVFTFVRVESVTLHPVDDSNSLFRGSVESSLNGHKIHMNVDVTYDAERETIKYKLAAPD